LVVESFVEFVGRAFHLYATHCGYRRSSSVLNRFGRGAASPLSRHLSTVFGEDGYNATASVVWYGGGEWWFALGIRRWFLRAPAFCLLSSSYALCIAAARYTACLSYHALPPAHLSLFTCLFSLHPALPPALSAPHPALFLLTAHTLCLFFCGLTNTGMPGFPIPIPHRWFRTRFFAQHTFSRTLLRHGCASSALHNVDQLNGCTELSPEACRLAWRTEARFAWRRGSMALGRRRFFKHLTGGISGAPLSANVC
jgi:hypothetical protein